MKTKVRLNSDQGMASIEALPLLVVFLVLVGYGLGLFGVIHTAILQSIAARTYAFETFRNRTNLTYFRENQSGVSQPIHYRNFEIRYHAIQSPTAQGNNFQATARPIAIGQAVEKSSASVQDHNVKIYELARRNREGGVEVSPAWVMIGYGMCLNANCGGK